MSVFGLDINDQSVEGNWEWVSEISSMYSNWRTEGIAEPSGDGDYTEIFHHDDQEGVLGLWNDGDCNLIRSFICEKR